MMVSEGARGGPAVGLLVVVVDAGELRAILARLRVPFASSLEPLEALLD